MGRNANSFLSAYRPMARAVQLAVTGLRANRFDPCASVSLNTDMALQTNTMKARWKVTDAEYDRMTRGDVIQTKYEIGVDLLADALGELSGTRGFDFGCGNGLFIQKLRARGARVEGCDVSSELVDADDPDAWVGDVHSLDRLQNENYDFFAVIMVMALLSEDEEAALFKHAYRVLKPSGAMLILTGNALTNPPAKAEKLADPFTFTSYLTEKGFEEVRQEFYSCMDRRWKGALRRLVGGQNRKIFDRAEIARFSDAYKKRRCFNYFSLSRKT